MNRFKVVKLRPDEWREYKGLRLQALQSEPHAFASSYKKENQKPDSIWQKRLTKAAEGKKSWILFARDQKKVIGMVGAYISEQKDIA